MSVTTVESRRDQRVLDNEAAFRRYAEGVAPLVESLGPPGPLEIRCECGDPACGDSLHVEVDVYRLARLDPVLVCSPGHAPGDGPPETIEGVDIVLRREPWDDAVARLSGALRRLVEDGDEVGTFVIAEGDHDRNIYVQFALQDGRLWCEAVHSRYLKPEDALGEPAIARLLRRGFRSPSTAEQNWFRVHEPGDGFRFASIARTAIGLFRDVYGLRVGLPVKIEASFEEWPKDPSAPHPTFYARQALYAKRKKRNRALGRRGGGPF